MDGSSECRADGYRDPRMRGFRVRTPVAEAVAWIDGATESLPAESVPLAEAAGRVLAEAIRAEFPVPHFARAAMDGYALRGEETFGADGYNPAGFRLVGESRPGRGFVGRVAAGQAVRIMTGAPLPEGADCVVPVESAEERDGAVRVVEATPPTRHVGTIGEDLTAGTTALESGRVLRPQDLGVLSALGKGEVSCVRRPRVAIIVTGDEILPAGTPSRGQAIPDMNSPMLAALVRRDGGLPTVVGPLADSRDTLRDALIDGTRANDVVLVSGGSSTGPEDHAPSLVSEIGRLVIHGVALRPASPAGMGHVGETFVALLPGNPVSCLCAYDFFASRAIRRLGARSREWPYRTVERPLGAKLVSTLGRVDYARVRIENELVMPLSTSGASILSSTTRADGFVVVPPDSEGLPAGSRVRVHLYDLER